MPVDPASLRREYTAAGLPEEAAGTDPFALFDRWFHEAVKTVQEPNAMVLATVSASGAPSSRVVLLKGYDERGFIFYTNYESHKGRDMDANHRVSLLFFWTELERQVRIEGQVTKTSRQESEEYFRSRPLESRIGAHASRQSSVIEGRHVLEARVKEIQERFGNDVPMPDFWGGYVVKPERIEFWQGRPARLHDRILFRREGEAWIRERLSP